MDKSLLPIRQQTLEFAQDKRWHLLPESARADCKLTLSRLLKQVLHSERINHEREDH